MKPRPWLVIFLAAALAPAAFGQFDFGKLSKGLDTLKDVGKVAKGAAKIGPEEEKIIGDSVALEIVGKYGGIVRDETVTRRVNLVGRAVARCSSRPDAQWKFGVLDSASVNAFSAPDGYVFITRGLYDLAETDDALAGILGHEIAHITKRHALSIVERGEFVSGVTGIASRENGNVRQMEAQLKQFDLGVEKILTTLFEKGFDPQTEYEADKEGRALAATTGYAAGGLRAVLATLDRRGGDARQVFSTHPPLKERIRRLPD
ncbi:MAG: peptidase Ste24p [Verrucomicrobia bacterium]|nr:peptidase Ste24p [Verrucomicrobiota bacterium]